MEKPEYLTGDALTFLEFVNQEYELDSSNPIGQYAQFYSQPFTKDMIVRPESVEVGRDMEYDTMDTSSESQVYHQKRHERIKANNNWQPLFKGEWEETGKQYDFDNIKFTLDDFIREAKKAGIKLEWK